jgi:hypothetical protein
MAPEYQHSVLDSVCLGYRCFVKFEFNSVMKMSMLTFWVAKSCGYQIAEEPAASLEE